MTRWYLHREGPCILLTVERIDDGRGFSRMWNGRLLITANVRRAMRVALVDLRGMVAEIDRPASARTYDPIEVLE